jgi:hypothetical protein
MTLVLPPVLIFIFAGYFAEPSRFHFHDTFITPTDSQLITMAAIFFRAAEPLADAASSFATLRLSLLGRRLHFHARDSRRAVMAAERLISAMLSDGIGHG